MSKSPTHSAHHDHLESATTALANGAAGAPPVDSTLESEALSEVDAVLKMVYPDNEAAIAAATTMAHDIMRAGMTDPHFLDDTYKYKDFDSTKVKDQLTGSITEGGNSHFMTLASPYMKRAIEEGRISAEKQGFITVSADAGGSTKAIQDMGVIVKPAVLDTENPVQLYGLDKLTPRLSEGRYDNLAATCSGLKYVANEYQLAGNRVIQAPTSHNDWTPYYFDAVRTTNSPAILDCVLADHNIAINTSVEFGSDEVALNEYGLATAQTFQSQGSVSCNEESSEVYWFDQTGSELLPCLPEYKSAYLQSSGSIPRIDDRKQPGNMAIIVKQYHFLREESGHLHSTWYVGIKGMFDPVDIDYAGKDERNVNHCDSSMRHRLHLLAKKAVEILHEKGCFKDPTAPVFTNCSAGQNRALIANISMAIFRIGLKHVEQIISKTKLDDDKKIQAIKEWYEMMTSKQGGAKTYSALDLLVDLLRIEGASNALPPANGRAFSHDLAPMIMDSAIARATPEHLLDAISEISPGLEAEVALRRKERKSIAPAPASEAASSTDSIGTEDLKAQLEKAMKDCEDYIEEINEAANTIGELQKEVAKLTRDLEVAVNLRRKWAENSEADMQTLTHECEALGNLVHSLESEKKTLNKNLEKANSDLSNVTSQRDSAHDLVKSLRKSLASSRDTTVETARLQEENCELKRRIKSLEEKIPAPSSDGRTGSETVVAAGAGAPPAASEQTPAPAAEEGAAPAAKGFWATLCCRRQKAAKEHAL